MDLITTRLKLKDVFPDLAKDYDDDAEFIRKGITPADLDIKEDERAIISYINTGAKDRDNEIVLPSGADLKDYRKNPVVLFGHDYNSLPIGKNMWIKSDDKGLIAKTQYANHEEAEKVYQYRKDGFPLAESIGFIPLEYKTPTFKDGVGTWEEKDLDEMGLTEKDVKGVRAVYTKWSMLEYSDVAVPSNPEAMELAKSKGLVKEEKVIVHKNNCECEACTNAKKNLDLDDEITSTNEDVSDLMAKMAATIESMSKTIADLKVELKTIQEDKAHTEHEKDYYTFSFDEEEQKDIDYASIIKEAIQSALAENKESTLNDIKSLTKEVFDKMSGKVIQS
jgi:HK97 family phage prohead protease